MRSRFKRPPGGPGKPSGELPPEASAPKGRGRKIKILILLALLAGGYHFLQEQVVDHKLRPLLQAELAKAVHSDVSIRSVRASLTGRVVLNLVSFTLPGDPWETRLSVEKIEVGLDLFDLLIHRKPLEQCLASLSLIRPNILLVHKETPPKPYGPPDPAEAPAVASAKPLPPLIPVRKVSVKNGSFSLQAGSTPREILSGLSFNSSEGKDGAWGLELDAHAPETKGKGTLQFNGSLRLGEWKASGKLALEQWPLASAGLALKELAGWTLEAGTVSLESPVVFEPGKGLWFDAHADFDQAIVRSPAPASIQLSQITGRALLRPSEISVPNGIAFQLGKTVFRAEGTMPLDGRPLSVKASTERLRLESIFEEILKLTNLKVEGTGSALMTVSGSFSDPIVAGTANLGSSKVGNWILDSLSVQAGYQKGGITLEKAEGKLYDGQFNADGAMVLSGRKDAPVSLKASLRGIEARKLAESFGLSGMEGKSDAEVSLSGTMDKPVLEADIQMALVRTLRDSLVGYSLHSDLLLKDGTLSFSSVLNDKTRLEGLLVESEKAWDIQKLFLTTGRKTGRLTGSGTWPKSEETPVDIRVGGTGILLQSLPFLSDQFPDVTGLVVLEGRLSGPKKALQGTLHLSSPEIRSKELSPQPLEASLIWKPTELEFEKLSLGNIFNVSGKIGLSAGSAMDLKIKALKVPLRLIGEVAGWNNPPQPFEGWITGSLSFTGRRENPVVQASEGIIVDSVRVADWHADRVEAQTSFDQGKLQVKKLKLTQGTGSMNIHGSWDTRSVPGTMALRFSARDFQLGAGPFLAGEFQWDAQTREPFWKNWAGTLSSPAFAIIDAKKTTYRFTDFSMPASCDELVLKGKVKLGKAISGSAVLDASQAPLKVKAVLKIAPALLSEVPEISQFIPGSIQASGRISGDIFLKEGPLASLPLSGSIQVVDGSFWNNKFDKLAVEFSGDKKKVSAIVSRTREETKDSLSGTLESEKVFWDQESRITLHGSVEKEKLSNLLSPLGVNAQQHKVAGRVDGDLSVSGTLSHPSVGFSVTGENLRYDDNLVPSAKLQFSLSDGKVLLEKNRITLPKGRIDIERGTASPDPSDPSLYLVDLAGSAEGVPIALFTLTSQIKITGKFALEDKPSRPTFEGRFSVLEPDRDPKNPAPFEIGLSIRHKIFEFKKLGGKETQLVGLLDLSKEGKITFQDLHLENSPGSFSVDGTLDMGGNSRLVSDAKDVPIEKVGRWILPDFPLKGTGNYHLIFEGNPDNPLVTASLSVSNGKMKDLNFDLLSGMLKSKENTLYLGSAEAPLVLSRKGLFTFDLYGKTPLSFTKTGGLRIKDREMDIHADMSQGDFGLILLAGLAKEASGSMDFSARVTGTMDSPVLTMDLDLKQCHMVPPLGLIAKSIDDLNGRIKVRNNRLAVEDLNAQIGPGRVFISTPPIDDSKILLVNFIPTFLDFRVKTVGERGVLLSIPSIMPQHPKEWGEIFFYGATKEEPLLIRGPLEEPRVIGTAKLDTGHYTFPPVIETDEKGGKIEFRELAGVVFDLKLASGKSTWYSNEVSTQYLELKVDPDQEIVLAGKDADRTPLEAGIKCSGSASSHEGYLRYLDHEFKMERASLYMPKGKPPTMEGHATDRLKDIEVLSAGGMRKTDVDIWVDFKGTFGNIDFAFDSNPRFSTDLEKHQKILLSYIALGRDMTGLSREEFDAAVNQKVGDVAVDAAWKTGQRYLSNELTKRVRSIARDIGNLEVDVKTSLPNPFEGAGNTGQADPLVRLELQRHLDVDPRLLVKGSFDVWGKDPLSDRSGLQAQIGLGYAVSPNLSLDVSAGQRENNQFETKGQLNYHLAIPNIIGPKKGDVDPPKFESFDIYSTGPGKFEVKWVTDESTKNEIWVLDDQGTKVRYFAETGQPDYKHTLVIEGLDPDQRYKIRISAKDPNGNETLKTEKAPAAE